MGNTGLLRREAEMTLLQPHLGETRRQELRNSSFWHSSLFKSQLVTLPPQKRHLRTLRVSDPIKISPFVVPTTRKVVLQETPRDPTATSGVSNSSQTVPQLRVPQPVTTSQPPRLVSRSGQLLSVEVAERIAAPQR